jgi:hypothetical protein
VECQNHLMNMVNLPYFVKPYFGVEGC